ncbi:MAG: hypothetical protein WCP74_10220 [Sphingobacteriia bacterium]|jgi:hypothetical protein
MSFKVIIFFLLFSTVATAQESNSNDSLKQLLPNRLKPELIDQNQQLNVPSAQNIRIYCKPTETNLNVLWMVNGKQISKTEFAKIHPGSIKNIEVLNPAEAIKKYGPSAKDGVILIFTYK